MIVRPAVIDDIPAIVGLLGELAQAAHEHAGGTALINDLAVRADRRVRGSVARSYRPWC